MHIALQAALLDVYVDEIMLPEASSDQVQVGKHSVRQIIDSAAIRVNDIVIGASAGVPHPTYGCTAILQRSRLSAVPRNCSNYKVISFGYRLQNR
jgi:hypothetical protein